MKGKYDILLVDDDDVYLFIAKHIFKKLSENLNVESFTDGEQALNFFKDCVKYNHNTPDVLLLDINMPYLDGWGFLEEYEKLRPNLNEKINVYLVTSSDQECDRERAKKV